MGLAAGATAWWWKNEDANWPDLHLALDTLKEARIDLGDKRHLAFVIEIGNRNVDFESYRRSSHWERDKQDFVTLNRLYQVVIKTTDLNRKGQAEQVRQRVLGDLRAELARLFQKVGPLPVGRGHPRDWLLRETLDQRPPGYFVVGYLLLANAPAVQVEAAEGRRIAWDADTIAATLLLTGVRRGSFDGVKRAVRAMVRRVEHSNQRLAAIFKLKKRPARKV